MNMNERKIQFFQAPKTYESQQVTKDVGVPMGLGLLAEAIKEVNPKAVVEIFDGNVESLKEMLEKISEGSIVGVSDWYSNHANSLDILKQAKIKDKNTTTIMGGPNATHLADRLLKNHDYIDYVIVGDGEESMAKLSSGENPENIPNLYYRDISGEVKFSFKKDAKLDKMYDLDSFDKKTVKRYTENDNPAPLSSIRGCPKTPRCKFCSLPTMKLRTMETNLVWEQIRKLNQKNGIKYFFETGDDFVIGDFPEQLLANRPEELSEVEFRIYASPRQITEKNVEILKKLNVKRIFIGLESGDEGLLKELNKRYTTEDVERSLDLLKNSGIEIQLPFMYGIPGETDETMEKTYQFAKRLIEKYPNITDILSTRLLPLVGCEYFKKLAENEKVKSEYPGDLEKDDEIDYKKLNELLIKHMTTVTSEDVEKYIQKTSELIKSKGGQSGSFGIVTK